MIQDAHLFDRDTRLIATYEEQKVEVLPSGRRIYRHPNGQGSVLEFDYWAE